MCARPHHWRPPGLCAESFPVLHVHPRLWRMKFADDTVVVGLITDSDERADLQEVSDLTTWYKDYSLLLNGEKTKEMVVDFCPQRCRTYTPLLIDGAPVERESSFKYLGVHISKDLSWTVHTDTAVKKARQHLYHLRQLSRFKVSQRILISFYSAAVQSILTGAISVWYGNSSCGDRRALQRVVRTAERPMATTRPPLHDLNTTRCTNRARRMIKDPHHPCSRLFVTLRSGRRLRCHKTVFSLRQSEPWTLNKTCFYCIVFYWIYYNVFYLHCIIFLSLLKLSIEVHYISQKLCILCEYVTNKTFESWIQTLLSEMSI